MEQYGLQKQVQQQQGPIPKKPLDSVTYAGGKGRKQMNLSLPAELVPVFQGMADELYELGEIPEPSVANLTRYSLRFFEYNYVRWMRRAFAELSAAKK